MRSQCNVFIVAIVITVVVIVIVVVRCQQGRRVRGRAGKMPGSGELVAVREVVADVETGGQVEHQVMEDRMLQDLRFRQTRVTARSLLPAPERTVHVEHHVAEHVAHQQQPQEIVAEELQHAGLYGCALLKTFVGRRCHVLDRSSGTARFVEEDACCVGRVLCDS